MPMGAPTMLNAMAQTKDATVDDDANSYLPFFGQNVLRQAASLLVGRQSGQEYDWKTECVISAGGIPPASRTLLIRPT